MVRTRPRGQVSDPEKARIRFLEPGIGYQVLAMGSRKCCSPDKAQHTAPPQAESLLLAYWAFHRFVQVRMTSGFWPGSIVPVRRLEIQVVRGQGYCHVPAWIRPTKGGERCPTLLGRHSTFVLFCFVYLLARVRWDMSNWPSVFAHRGLFCEAMQTLWA